jgi:hypothetical protein
MGERAATAMNAEDFARQAREHVPGEPTSIEEFPKRGLRHPRLLIPALKSRMGVSLFAVMLEYKHYRPGSSRNDDFQMMDFGNWKGLPWWVFSIPAEDRSIAEQVCRLAGMRLANGEPHIIQNGSILSVVTLRHPIPAKWQAEANAGILSCFPMRGSNVFQLENDWENPAWKLRHSFPAEARIAEEGIAAAIIEHHTATLPYELAADKSWIECRTCHMRSFHPDDVDKRYCGFCQKFHLPLDGENSKGKE